MDTEAIIKELIRQRDDFLNDHPELMDTQIKINETLFEVGNDPIERCRAMTAIMLAHSNLLQSKFKEMKSYIEESNVVGRLDRIIKDLESKRKELESDNQGK